MLKKFVTVLLVAGFVAGSLSACGVKGELKFPGSKNVQEMEKSEKKSGDWVK